MSSPSPIPFERIRADFDEIASLADAGESGINRYDALLLSLIPHDARHLLDVGCGMGRLTWAMARADRHIVGVDLSAVMIERSQRAGQSPGVSFYQCDFLTADLGFRDFDCIVSAAALHHMPQEAALARMSDLLRPGGRLIVQDVRRDVNLADTARAYTALMHAATGRLLRTGRPFKSRRVRQAWARHAEIDTYLTLAEARALAGRCLPGAQVMNHWLWRYTVVWDKPVAESGDLAIGSSGDRIQ